MTDTTQKLESPSTQAPIVVIPVSAIAAARGLTGSQYDLWLYLYQIDRYGNGEEIPTPRELEQILGHDERTIKRNVQRLEDLGLFHFEIKKWRGYNLKARDHFENNFSLGKEIPFPAERSICRQNDPFVQNGKNAKTLTGKEIARIATNAKQCTNNRKNLKNKTIGTNTPTAPPCSGAADAQSAIDSEEMFPTPEPLLQELLEQVERVNLKPNKTIQTALAELLKTTDRPAARRAVENACSALTEQRSKGLLKNPGGFFVAALRRGFTSNDAKQQARVSRLQAPEMTSVEIAIDQALVRGDRPWPATGYGNCGTTATTTR